MSVLKKLLSDTALYGISSILGRTLNYFLVILHTAVFASQEFGIQSELYIYVAFLQIIYLYGMETAFFRYSQKYDIAEAYNLTMSSIVISTTFFTILLLLFSENIAFALGYAGRGNLIRYVAYILAIDALLAIPFARLRQENKAKVFALTKIANILLVIGLNIFFLWFCKGIFEGNFLAFLKPIILLIYSPDLGIGYIFLANLLANAFQVLLLYRTLLQFRFRFNWQKFKPILVYAYPLIFTGLAGMVNNLIDRLMLKYYLPVGFYAGKNSIEAMGIYAACAKLSIFMSLAIQAFRYAAEPFFFSQAQDKNAPQVFARVMRYFIIVCCMIYVLVSLNTEILGQIFLRKAEYRAGLVVVPFLLLGNLLLGIYFNLSAWFKITEKTYFGTYFSFIGAFFTIFLNFLLIPHLGYVGCAISFVVVSLLMVVLGYAYGQKYFPVPYQINNGLGHIFWATLVIIASKFIQFSDFWQNFVWLQIVFFIYIVPIIWIEKQKITLAKSK
ncbi:MAG: polysaccharide biosynthesis C-terminal domain-containing protein [Microscillaceae bacterium]|nr:polysaccharide biosynthesis C-terminal domain-containing protein [Microscillaceae bacterium]MDW8460060.1 polysaccharide biosynthesis C-terminal domain-containing protein [Cytophagales bacterium]